jgi:leader peptidase (prepilin peptidase)/N-methyltransferase
MLLSELPPTFLLGLAAVLGLLFGSFSNVVIHRLPRGENIAFPASHCPACHQPIAAYDNLPVLSFLWLRGRARCCKARIKWRYPAVELLGGLWALAVMRLLILDAAPDAPLWRASLLFVLYLALGLTLICCIFIDLDYMILPDPLTLGGAAVGLLSAPLRGSDWIAAGVGAAVGFGVVWLLFVEGYRRLRGYPGMGLGDAKLLLLTGAWFGWEGVLFALLGGSLLGTLTALVVYVTRGQLPEPEGVVAERKELLEEISRLEGAERAELEAELALDPLFAEPAQGLARARLAFGPFLAVATLAYALVGPDLVAAYLSVGEP